MAWLKGERRNGYIQVDDQVSFNANIIGGGLGTPLPYRSKIYYVDGLNGSDTANSGTSPDAAFATIEQAITTVNARIDWSASPWAKFDYIYIAPGTYAENITALPHGVTMVGMGHDVRDAQAGVKIKPASGIPVTASACVNSAFYNIGFESPDTNEAFYCGILNNCYFQDCFFSGTAEAVTTTEAFYTNDSVKTTFRRCWFANAGYGMRFEYADGGDSISYVLIDECYVTGCGTAGIYTSTNLVGPHSMIKNTHVGGGGQTLTTGIDDNSNLFEVNWCTIEATTAIDGGRGVNGSYGNGVLLT